MGSPLWQHCRQSLAADLPPPQFATWIQPLHAIETQHTLTLLAPNRFVLDWVRARYLERIMNLLGDLTAPHSIEVSLQVGTQSLAPANLRGSPQLKGPPGSGLHVSNEPRPAAGLNPNFTFETFVEGKSNQLARAAALQVAENPGRAYNPLFISGGVGLGKTHCMHAVGNLLGRLRPEAHVVYLHSERFVADMVKALQHNTVNEFKRFYRSADALLIDDIQFFAGKERSQEEFFHTFNALLDGEHQIVLTCDRYPKEVQGVAERLRSRFGWGLTVAIEPPELETRVAILKSKAELAKVELPDDVAFFVAKRFRSNVREIEGALHRVMAHAQFTGRPVSLEFAKEALKDLLALQEKLITIESIQRTVAEYYKMRVSDLISHRRSRSITRPRHIAIALTKELTNHSLPEIGDAFGGRDHTTVLHACRKVADLRKSDTRINDDFVRLYRILST